MTTNAANVECGQYRAALLHILGDIPSPMEDAYERCRKMAAAALGFREPVPDDQIPWLTVTNEGVSS